MKTVQAIMIVAAILILLAASGIIVYNAFIVPVWTEQLQYKNSTGQFQQVTVYRNATNVPYDNLTRFLSSNDIESLVYADSYRPVEYAALMHDLAEAQGINCTVIGSRIDNDTPMNAVDAFYTTDRGMVYIDPTGMNVTQADYTVPFDSITLLRKQWTVEVPWVNASNVQDNITVYREARPVSYSELLAFIYNDDTYDMTYALPTFTCEDFATRLYTDAEKNGIKSGVVYINFSDVYPGHMVNVFPTTDKGLVYVDDTGLNVTQQNAGDIACPRIVYISNGNVLGELPANQTNGDLDYSFYQGRMQDIQAYEASVQQYENDYSKYGSDLQAFNADESNYNAALADYNAKMATHNNAVNAYNSDYQQYQQALADHGDPQTLAQMQTKLQQEYQQIPAAPSNGASLDSWRNRLIATQNSLNSRADSLNNTRLSLLGSEARNWLAFYPIGTVGYTDTYWG